MQIFPNIIKGKTVLRYGLGTNKPYCSIFAFFQYFVSMGTPLEGIEQCHLIESWHQPSHFSQIPPPINHVFVHTLIPAHGKRPYANAEKRGTLNDMADCAL